VTRARQYRAQALKLADIKAFEPNWPKYYLVTHAIELAITAYLVFEKGLGRPRSGGKKPDNHDLMALYEEAIDRGLKSNPLVLKELPHLSELHKFLCALSPN
jgi:hypothetical protein